MATPIPTNRCSFTLAEVVQATDGVLINGDPTMRVQGISTDTRTVEQGALFVALVGDTHDGHTHLDSARQRGASALLVRTGTGASGPSIEVRDTLESLGKLARFHADRVRAKKPIPSIAITGSAGKTTTKELAAAAVRALFGNTLVTAGNLNNRIGVPMTLFTLDDTHNAMVIECGTSARGEIAFLGEIVAPDVGVVLNADAGHTEGLGTVEDVAEEKGALFRAARRVAIGNADDQTSLAKISNATQATQTFGESSNADFRLLSRTPNSMGATVVIQVPRDRVDEDRLQRIVIELRVLGRAAAIDTAAALAATFSLRNQPLDSDEIARISAEISKVLPTPGRLSPIASRNGLVIDDTYNANPRSVRSSLASAQEIASSKQSRLIVVLGDMLELGDLSATLHAQLGTAVVDARASVFVAVGPQMALAARVAAASGEQAPLVIETLRTDDAATVVESIRRDEDVVLVKGSRGMRMESIVQALARERDGAGVNR